MTVPAFEPASQGQVPVRPRALIVEDDLDGSDALRALLTKKGYAVECVATLADAAAKLSDLPERVILDLRLPDGSGLSLLRRIRADGLPARVAILTGTTDSEMLSEVILLRPDALFIKPPDYAEVLTWLRTDPPPAVGRA